MMKKLVLLTLLATSLATQAAAAITAGIELGYLTDGQEAYWSGRGGWAFNTSGSLSHQVELEIGHTEDKAAFGGPAGPLSFKMKITPLTINYRVETTPADKLGFYFGAGLGQSRVSISGAGSGVPNISDSDNAFTVQAFTGLSYKATPATTLHAGLKYLRIGEAELFGATDDVGDDLILTAGVSIRF
jgi:opacity protein-like surface antigen